MKRFNLTPDSSQFPPATAVTPEAVVAAEKRVRELRDAGATQAEIDDAIRAHEELAQEQVRQLREIALASERRRMMP